MLVVKSGLVLERETRDIVVLRRDRIRHYVLTHDANASNGPVFQIDVSCSTQSGMPRGGR